LRISSLIIVLISCLAVGSALSAFGQTSTPSSSITVTADKSSYSNADQMTISGTVSSKLNVPISIIIKDPSQNPVEIGQTNVNSDNTYSTQMVAGGRLWTAVGTYEVDVTYGSAANTAKTTFTYTGNVTGTSGNQTIPEFGSMAFVIATVSIIGTILISNKLRVHF
jgi:predicted secreted protein with PEFG-CTERM motif